MYLLEGRVEFAGLAAAAPGGDRGEPPGAGRRPPDASGGPHDGDQGAAVRAPRPARGAAGSLGYALCLLLLTEALLRFGGGGPRAVLSLMNVVLTFVPLVSLVFGTMYLYGSRELHRAAAGPAGGPPRAVRGSLRRAGRAARRRVPARRRAAVPLGRGGDGSLAGPVAMLLGAGTLLTLVFTALAMLVSLPCGGPGQGARRGDPALARGDRAVRRAPRARGLDLRPTIRSSCRCSGSPCSIRWTSAGCCCCSGWIRRR